MAAGVMRYKGYEGSVEPHESGWAHGKLLHISDLVTYEANTLAELEAEFTAAVDEYLKTCETLGRAPDIPNSHKPPQMSTLYDRAADALYQLSQSEPQSMPTLARAFSAALMETAPDPTVGQHIAALAAGEIATEMVVDLDIRHHLKNLCGHMWNIRHKLDDDALADLSAAMLAYNKTTTNATNG